MKELAVSEIQVIPVKPRDGLVAFASAVVNNQFYVGNIAIYTCPASEDGFRLVYPSKSLSNGTKVSIVHPVNKETGLTMQRQIVSQYLKLVEDLMKGDIQNGRESRVS